MYYRLKHRDELTNGSLTVVLLRHRRRRHVTMLVLVISK